MTPTLQRVAAQLQAQAAQISAPAGLSSAGPSGVADDEPNFTQFLFNSISDLNKTQQTAQHQAEAWMSGDSKSGLNDVMLSMQKSSLALSLGVQVRNKVLSAYQEIMNMPV